MNKNMQTVMHKTTIAFALVASLTLGSVEPAAAQGPADPGASSTTTSGPGLARTNFPVLVDPAADLTANPDRPNESWYLTAQVTAGGHRYGFFVHYLSSGDAKQGLATSSVSITNEDTGWYTRSAVALPPRTGLSDKQGVDIHTANVTWTGGATEMNLRATVPEGTIDVTLRPHGNVLYDMGTGYFPMFGDANYLNIEYAFTTVDTTGTLTLNGHTENVRGQSWLDRQWGPLPSFASGQFSWAWMNISLSNGDTVSLAEMHGGKPLAWASILKSDGTETVAAATLTPDNSTLWTSPETGQRYPTRWKVTIPGEHAKLNVKVCANDQELVIPAGRFEGAAAITGTYEDRPVTGFTYVEVAGAYIKVAGR